MMSSFLMLMKLQRMMKFFTIPLWKRKTLNVMSLRVMILVDVRVQTIKTLKKVMKMTFMSPF